MAKTCAPASRRKDRRNGQVLILVTLAIPVLFGLLGLLVDIGWMHFRQEMAQTAADAAVMAAVGKAIENGNGAFVCGASQVGCQSRTLCSTSLPPHPTNSLDVACAYASTNGFTVTSGGRQFVYVTAGASSSPPRSPNVYSDYWVTVEVVETAPQLFSAVLGNTMGTVSARASAGVGYTTPASCVYVLDPAAASAFDASGGITVNAGCGIFVNSSSATALTVSGGATVNTSVAKVAGGYKVSGGSHMTPLPTAGTAVTPDPFGGVAAPTYSGCLYTNKSVGNGAVVNLSPGVYCNGLTLGGGATVTFSPGVYVMNGGGLTISNGAHVSGSGVTFFNTSNGYTYKNLTINGGTVVTLSAPTTGTYRGLLYYNDRTINAALANTVSGGTDIQLTGSLYSPSVAFSYSGGSSTTVTAILAKTVSFNGGAYLASDITGTKTGLGSMIPRVIE